MLPIYTQLFHNHTNEITYNPPLSLPLPPLPPIPVGVDIKPTGDMSSRHFVFDNRHIIVYRDRHKTDTRRGYLIRFNGFMLES